ncbi:hypothetical protein FRX31_007104, partial [Thalictrum thalictroides]
FDHESIQKKEKSLEDVPADVPSPQINLQSNEEEDQNLQDNDADDFDISSPEADLIAPVNAPVNNGFNLESCDCNHPWFSVNRQSEAYDLIKEYGWMTAKEVEQSWIRWEHSTVRLLKAQLYVLYQEQVEQPRVFEIASDGSFTL